MKSIALFTSIAPRNVDGQLDALVTWRSFAARIVTVNEARESQLLSDLPSWIECQVFDDEIPYPRPYVRLSKLASCIETAAAGYDLAAFCNSDISLASRDLAAIIDQDASDLVFSSRTDTDDAGRPIEIYADGFDFFCFRPEHAHVIAHDDMYIGLPWWDFLVPLAFVRDGLTATRLDGRHINHVKHPQKWDRGQYYEKANIVLRAITGWPDARPFADDEVNHFTLDANSFLNSWLLTASGRSSQHDALRRLVAFWCAKHEGTIKTGWTPPQSAYMRLAIATKNMLEHYPLVHRILRPGHRMVIKHVPQKRTPLQELLIGEGEIELDGEVSRSRRRP